MLFIICNLVNPSKGVDYLISFRQLSTLGGYSWKAIASLFTCVLCTDVFRCIRILENPFVIAP